MTIKTVLEAVHDAMQEEMRRDETVFVMGEDIGARGGVFLATEGFLDVVGRCAFGDTKNVVVIAFRHIRSPSNDAGQPGRPGRP